MEEQQEPYVIYPHSGSEQTQPDLDPKDKLIYLAIRRYMNRKTMEAFPSYARITEDTGAAAKTIKKCVDNLVKEEYLETRKDGRKIVYKFNNKKQFEPFSYDFLDKPDLTFTEKSYIVATQQFMFKNKETLEGNISFPNNKLANLINMSPATISRCNHSLEKKGYLEGASDSTKRFQLRELDQMIIWKLQQQENRLDVHENDITFLKKEVQRLSIECEKLRNQDKSNTFIL